MNVNEMKEIIKEIISTNQRFGITPFTCIKKDNETVIKRLNVNDKLYDRLFGLIFEALNKYLLQDDVELDSAENIADNHNILYEIIQDNEYKPFGFLYEHEVGLYDYKKDQDSVCGYAFRVNLNSKFFWIYQHVFSVTRIGRSNAVYAVMTGKNTYTVLKSDIIKIGEKIDAVIIGNSIITSNIKLMQSCFGFDRYLRKEAKRTIDLIEEQGIVSDISKFYAFEDKQKTTNAKKLMKAKSSPVLKMKKKDLLEGIKRHNRYKAVIKIENGHIVINTQKDVNEYIKMLNDDILRSDLTNVEYDSTSKQELPPV